MTKKIVKLGAILLTSSFFISCDDDNNTTTPTTPAGVSEVDITFSAVGPVAFAPILFAAHDGTVDFFDTGSAASATLETLAELGNVNPAQAALASSVDSISTGINPIGLGGTVTRRLNIDAANTYFSYIGMVLPTSDTFVGNNNPTAFNFRTLLADNDDSFQIQITRLYDAGTEVNNFLTSPGGPLVGAPAGVAANGVATPNAVITLSTPNFYNGYLGAGTFNVSQINPNGRVVGTIRVTRVR